MKLLWKAILLVVATLCGFLLMSHFYLNINGSSEKKHKVSPQQVKLLSIIVSCNHLNNTLPNSKVKKRKVLAFQYFLTNKMSLFVHTYWTRFRCHNTCMNVTTVKTCPLLVWIFTPKQFAILH